MQKIRKVLQAVQQQLQMHQAASHIFPEDSHQNEPPRVPPSMDEPQLPPPRQSTNNAANRAPTPPRDITPPPPGPSSSIYSSNILITTSPHPNTREAQLQIHQAASHPIFPEDGKPLEPPPPYSMCSASSNTQYTPSVNANSPPSYSQSFADYFEFDI